MDDFVIKALSLHFHFSNLLSLWIKIVHKQMFYDNVLYSTWHQHKPRKRLMNSLSVPCSLSLILRGKLLLVIEISGDVKFRKALRYSKNMQRVGQMFKCAARKKEIIDLAIQQFIWDECDKISLQHMPN